MFVLYSQTESKMAAIICGLATAFSNIQRKSEASGVSPQSEELSFSEAPGKLLLQSHGSRTGYMSSPEPNHGARRMPGVNWLRPVSLSQSRAREMRLLLDLLGPLKEL